MPYPTFIIGDIFTGGIRGYALGAYHPLWLKTDSGGRQKNPAFDQHSQHVLNLKFPGTKYFDGSIKYCAAKLALFVKNEVKIDRAEFLIVPSSTQGNTSVAMEKIVTAICKWDKRLSYRPGSLFRTKTIEKLAKGGDRSVGVHLASMDYKHDANAPTMKILLDDVTTSGNSLSGAIMVVQQYDQGATFFPVVFGKTTHE